MSRMDVAAIAAQAGAGRGGLGTKKTVMEYAIPVESASPDVNTEDMTREGTLGHPFPTDREPGTQHFEPSMSGACRSASLVRLLSSFWGDPTTTTPDATNAPTARQHAFDVALAAALNPRALSLIIHRADPSPAITDLVWDALGNELALSIEPNDWIVFDASWVARELEPIAAPALNADLTRRFGFYETKAYVAVAGGAETEVAVGSFGLTYGLNVPTDNHVLGSRKLYAIQAGNRDLAVTFQPKQDLSAYYRRAIATEPESLAVRLEALGPVIGGTVRHRVTIRVPRVFEVEAPADIDAGDTLQGVDVSCAAAYDAATGKFLTAEVVNTVNSYAVV